jgi:hypothetical protein
MGIKYKQQNTWVYLRGSDLERKREEGRMTDFYKSILNDKTVEIERLDLCVNFYNKIDNQIDILQSLKKAL